MKALRKDILPIAVVGTITYFAMKLLSKNKSEQGTNEIPNIAPGASYKDKVIALQKGLGVGPDGIAGQETNGTLENLYTSPPKRIDFKISAQQNYPNLRAKGKGVVSSDNIDFYLNALRNKSYPSAVYTSNQITSNDAKSVKAAYEKGGILKTRNSAVFKGVIKDTSRNVYVSTGKSYKYDANASFIIPEAFARSRVKIIAITSLGNLIVQVSPATIQYPINQPVYYLLIKPSDLIVSN